MIHIDHDYIIYARRELHKIPEIGLNLPKTVAFIRNELDSMGIEYTESFGKSSIVATINKGKGNKTIALRADTDALPIQEKTGLPFSSLHEGKMHACGHDCHAAMLLGVAKALKENESKIACCVKLIFQSAEEGPGGAKLLCEDGVMKDIDMIIGCHISPVEKSGLILTNQTCMNASSHGFKIFIHGKSCHVASPQNGVDAIAIGARVYQAIQTLRAREIDPTAPVVIGIGEFHGGHANNIVCDEVMMHGTIRTQTPDMDRYIYQRIEEIAKHEAEDMGGSAEVVTTKFYPCLINDKALAQDIEDEAIDLFGNDMFQERKPSMGAEDFSYYTLEKPAAFFTLGCMNGDEKIPLHNEKMSPDEGALDKAPRLMIRFILDHMNA